MTISDDVPVDTSFDPDLAPPEYPDRQIVGDLIEEEVYEEPEVTELSAEERRDFSTLLTCGRRSKTISVMGHTVKIQTLTTADEMRVGLYTKKYLESQLGFQRAYNVAVCAAGVREVQGKPLYNSLSPATDDDEVFDKKIDVLKGYYPVVITMIYQEIMNLEREFAELAIKLGKLNG